MYYPVLGSKIFIQSAIAAAKNITGATNVSPTVLTSTAHGFADNDEVLINSGWEDLDGSVFRVDQLTADTFSLPGFDATNTDWYPAGSGTGTAKKITTWLQIGQVLGVTGGGGSPKTITANPIDRRNPVIIPVGFEASTLQLTLGYDPALAAQVEMLSASRALGKRAIKFILPGGGYAYAYGTVALSSIPTFDTNSVMQKTMAMSLDGMFTQY